MKKTTIFILSALFAACGQAPKEKTSGTTGESDGVEVILFHAKRRCPTCIAMERLTREVVENEFASQLADGELALRVVDISKEEATAERYGIAWSSLLVNRRRNGTESVNNLTQSAFANARTNPGRFRAELKAGIEKALGR